MDALTAPRAYKKPENASQNKMRGLGIEESDSKGHSDSMPAHHREVPKPRGKRFRRSTLNMRIYRLVCFLRGNEIQPHNGGIVTTRKRISKSTEETAKGIGIPEEEAPERETRRPETTLCCDREDHQRKKVWAILSATGRTFGREIQLSSFSLFLVSIAKRNFRETRPFVAKFPNKLFNGLDWRIGNDARNVTWYVLIWRNDGIACENYAWLLNWPSKSNLLHDTSARSKRWTRDKRDSR